MYSLITNQGRPRDAASLAAELDDLYYTIDASTAYRAEILTAIALLEFITCRFERPCRRSSDSARSAKIGPPMTRRP